MTSSVIDQPIKTSHSFLRTIINAENIILKKILDDCVDVVAYKLVSRPTIMIYGKECHQPRDVAFFSNESRGYYYSGKLSTALPLDNPMKKLLAYANGYFKSSFNGILVNRYNDGCDSIGRHCDDERHCDTSVGVVALSHGAVRKLRIRDKKNGIIIKDILMQPYQFIHMGGDFQKEFTHEIPRETKIKTMRYSFTFRKHSY